MPPLDQHLISFFIRALHVISMALLLGGAVLCWAMTPRAGTLDTGENGLLLVVARKYEFIFWLAIGIQLITGIGNIGVFGAQLPGPETVWGAKLALKLLAFLVLLLASLPRAALIGRLHLAGELSPSVSRPRVLAALYGGTAVFVAGMVVVAVSLAHG